MGKVALARRLADELGTSVSKARRLVDDVGPRRARATLDRASGAGDEIVLAGDDAGSAADDAADSGGIVSDYWKPAAATAAIGGGGALAYRQQNIWSQNAIAEQNKSYSEAVESIADSDLAPRDKQAALDDLNESAPASGENENKGDGGGGGGGGDGPFSGLLDNPMTMVIVLVVVVVVVRSAMTGDIGGGGA